MSEECPSCNFPLRQINNHFAREIIKCTIQTHTVCDWLDNYAAPAVIGDFVSTNEVPYDWPCYVLQMSCVSCPAVLSIDRGAVSWSLRHLRTTHGPPRQCGRSWVGFSVTLIPGARKPLRQGLHVVRPLIPNVSAPRFHRVARGAPWQPLTPPKPPHQTT